MNPLICVATIYSLFPVVQYIHTVEQKQLGPAVTLVLLG